LILIKINQCSHEEDINKRFVRLEQEVSILLNGMRSWNELKTKLEFTNKKNADLILRLDQFNKLLQMKTNDSDKKHHGILKLLLFQIIFLIYQMKL